ncbi:MAG: NAD-dependent epimerase/dehydratase family protein [Cytophagales bacterium]|nr:MAG: NAD-dependent epimerase/dehydratase family protein [Cytophagales bacterium]TAF59862.1 MAG: NAD-dependent epimerase/dehydratase family protein [Cytophagales bacterium]
MKPESILITGACGQIGTELALSLRQRYGKNAVVVSDVREPQGELADGPFEMFNVTSEKDLERLHKQYGFTQIYHLAALLSATGEKNPLFTWKLNMDSLLHVLELARQYPIKVYWPSSIAVFGPETPANHTPQHTVITPRTVYGISKLSGEHWCKYYYDRYNVDVRSIRYPGLISYKTPAGGGTTDYAVDIFYQAIDKGYYECFLTENTFLPMMYMPDAIRATLELMDSPKENIKNRWSYNLAGISFSPAQLAAEIKKLIPDFSIAYKPDFRQKIADTWPNSIDDYEAQQDWGWKNAYDLSEMTNDMIKNLKIKLKSSAQ